jgi:AcrR family transcriptional regulator
MIEAMSRWKPDARGRLEQAASELFLDQGYDQTSVADIAARAGLTERTFFRHYADKREVLFSGAAELQARLLQALEGVPPGLPAIEAVRIAVETMTTLFKGRRSFARERQRIIVEHPDLLERELIKRARLTALLAQGLERRGVSPAAASIAADMGIGVFYVGFVRWLDDPADRELVEVVHEGFDQLKAVAAGA